MLLGLLIHMFGLLASPWPTLAGVALGLLLNAGWAGTVALVGPPALLFVLTTHLRDLLLRRLLGTIIDSQRAPTDKERVEEQANEEGPEL